MVARLSCAPWSFGLRCAANRKSVAACASPTQPIPHRREAYRHHTAARRRPNAPPPAAGAWWRGGAAARRTRRTRGRRLLVAETTRRRRKKIRRRFSVLGHTTASHHRARVSVTASCLSCSKHPASSIEQNPAVFDPSYHRRTIIELSHLLDLAHVARGGLRDDHAEVRVRLVPGARVRVQPQRLPGHHHRHSRARGAGGGRGGAVGANACNGSNRALPTRPRPAKPSSSKRSRPDDATPSRGICGMNSGASRRERLAAYGPILAGDVRRGCLLVEEVTGEFTTGEVTGEVTERLPPRKRAARRRRCRAARATCRGWRGRAAGGGGMALTLGSRWVSGDLLTRQAILDESRHSE